MKKFFLHSCLVTLVSFLLQSCVKDTLQTTYTYYAPVYKSKTEVWQSIKSASPQPLKQTGKLFLYGKYIFINELNKGVHIIDNSNPQAPKNISFISIPGNIDIAVKNNSLYADLYTDMVTIDIADPANIVLKKVSDNVFPERDYGNGFTTDSTRYVVDWVKQQTVNKKDINEKSVLQLASVMYSDALASQNSNSGKAVVGVSGSMARFTIVNDYLYTVGRFNLTPFNISSANDPVMGTAQPLGWEIETIYPLNDKLFIGSQTGMFIYSIANAASPSFLGSFSHACFRDPVIADDQFAYVTLRATNASACWNGVAAQRNEMDVINISDITHPFLVKIYNMTEPRGLSKDGDYLFICDGKAGLKIYNASNVQDIKQINAIDDINAFDVICQNGLAIVVAEEGICQYDYTNISNPRLLSKMEINKQ